MQYQNWMKIGREFKFFNNEIKNKKNIKIIYNEDI